MKPHRLPLLLPGNANEENPGYIKHIAKLKDIYITSDVSKQQKYLKDWVARQGT